MNQSFLVSRIKRRSDGSDVNVPARHRGVAAADKVLSPTLIPTTVDHWVSRVHLGPKRMYGRWSAASDENEAHLEAMRSMKTRMHSPNAMQDWFDSKRREFEALPEDQ